MNDQRVIAGIGLSLQEKIEVSIALLREMEQSALNLNPINGYHLAFSGGKDSIVIKKLAQMAGVKFKAWYSQTTIDPPELIRYIKEFHKDVFWRRPKRNFFRSLIDSHGLPTRLTRWCCSEFKESGGDGQVKILGVRAAESARRKKIWKPVTIWHAGMGGYCVNPILYWSDEDVWQFIADQNLPYCSLYDEGWKRLGCIGCPLAGPEVIRKGFARWPSFEKTWRWAANQYYNQRIGTLNRYGKRRYIERFSSGDEFFDWWLSDNPSPVKSSEEGCLGLFDGELEADQTGIDPEIASPDDVVTPIDEYKQSL